MIKKLLAVTLVLLSVACSPAPVFAESIKTEAFCQVEVCNKLSRISLDPFKHMQDKIGESCSLVWIPKEEAFVGNVLSSESRWYQGSFNPTKKSVTKVTEVIQCKELK